MKPMLFQIVKDVICNFSELEKKQIALDTCCILCWVVYSQTQRNPSPHLTRGNVSTTHTMVGVQCWKKKKKKKKNSCELSCLHLIFVQLIQTKYNVLVVKLYRSWLVDTPTVILLPECFT